MKSIGKRGRALGDLPYHWIYLNYYPDTTTYIHRQWLNTKQEEKLLTWRCQRRRKESKTSFSKWELLFGRALN